MAHTPEVQHQLALMGDLLGEDYSTCTVYGSTHRPMSAAWARIPGAIFMQTDQARQVRTRVYTYVGVPAPLDQRTIESYELTFVSAPEREQ